MKRLASPDQLRFDYESLDDETRLFVEHRAGRIHNLARRTAEGIRTIGQLLTETKERLGHGHFTDWLEGEFAWSESSAERFMRVYSCFKSITVTDLKSDAFADLEIDIAALYTIAARSTPELVRAEVIRRAGNGERVSKAGALALKREFAETGVIPALDRSLSRMIKERPLLAGLGAAERWDGVLEAFGVTGDVPEAASDVWAAMYRAGASELFKERVRRTVDNGARLLRALPTKENNN